METAEATSPPPAGAALEASAREPIPLDRTHHDLARAGRLTPMLRQFAEVKEQHPDSLLLFRLGDFYECFFQDAVKAAEILEITLTARGKGDDRYAMAGIPHHAARGYIGRLVEAGQKVALADQVEDAAEAKGLVRREVVRVITPGMVVDDQLLDPRAERLLGAVALLEGGGGGLALIEVSTGAFRVARLESEAALADELCRAAPRELLFDAEADPARVEALRARVPAAAVSLEPSDLFSAREGERVLQSHFGVQTLAGFGVPTGAKGAPLRAAAGAALRYARATQRERAAHVDALRVFRPADFLALDEATRANLELFVSLQDKRRKGSLLAHIDRSRTAMGGRLIGQWLAFPLRDLEAISARQDALAELIGAGALRGTLRAGLREVADIERLVGRLALSQGSARDLKQLGATLEALGPLQDAALAGLQAPLSREAAQGLRRFDPFAQTLQAALVDEPPAALREGGLFRVGYDAALDELIALSTDGKALLLQLEARERERTQIPTLKVRYNRVFGYYIEVTKAHAAKVPDDYERRQTMKGAERFITPELKELEAKILGAEEARRARELALFEALRAQVIEAAPALRRLAGEVATLDVLAALAELAAEEGWSRPLLSEGRHLYIEEGRHPVVEAALRRAGGEPFVGNDLRLPPEQHLMVITGPNMAGKSTVMRQTALITILAHMGSYVPARAAELGLCDRVFTRVGASDDLARGQSTFMVEMTETANILHHATEQSLVILDEIGRGTSTFDGVSIAWAVAEQLHDAVGCRTLFATHYHELTDLERTLPRVQNATIAVSERNGEVAFLRRLVPGAASRSYGIHVARLAGLPAAVLARAGEVLANLEAGELDDRGRPLLAQASAGRGAPQGQLSLFGGGPRRPSEVERLVETLAPDELSPRQALELVYRLCELRAHEGAGEG